MNPQIAVQPSSRLARTLDWIIRILLALAFIAAGSFKLATAPQFVALFDQLGIGQWFRLLTGTLEVVCHRQYLCVHDTGWQT